MMYTDGTLECDDCGLEISQVDVIRPSRYEVEWYCEGCGARNYHFDDGYDG